MWGRIDVNSLPTEDRDEIFNFWKAKRVDLQTFGNYIESVWVNHSDLTYKEIIKSAITLYNNELLSKKSQKTDAPVKRKIFPFEEMIKKMTTVKPFVQSPPKRPRSAQFWEGGDWTKGISVLDILIYLLIFFYLS